MATIHLDEAPGAAVLTVRFTRGERVAGLLRDVRVPLGRVASVEVVDDGLRAVRGMRAPGLALPGLRKIGTWRRRGHRAAVCVRRDEPAVRVTLTGDRWAELLVGAPDAVDVAARVQRAVDAVRA